MIVIEISEDKYGKAMKAISCMEEKLACIKDIFEDEAMAQRRYGRGREMDYRYEDKDRDYKEREEREYRRGRYE